MLEQCEQSFPDQSEQFFFQQLKGVKYIPAAVFNEEYQKARGGKIFISIPEVYELVNIGIAISDNGIEEKYKVYKKSDYYNEVQKHFEPYRNHPFIQKLDSIFDNNENYYASLKMNGNSFVFDEQGQIVQSPIFNRTGFRGQKTNMLSPFVKEMQSFSDESNFRSFYKENGKVYRKQVDLYKDSIQINEMQNWLQKHFPNQSAYDTYNIIFSPLVAYNQSSTWFESNGFKELQPHVNFPYLADVERLFPLTKEAEYIYRGNIVFTEINHGYINPEADKYREQIRKAISNRHVWVDSTRTNYYEGNALFNEYMNWGLINLRIIDYVSENERQKLIDRIIRSMLSSRDFIKFKEFSDFLVDLYVNREKEATIASLYPRIIQWFSINNN